MRTDPQHGANTALARTCTWRHSRRRVRVVHELALMEGVVDHVIAHVDARVVSVTLEIGELAGVDLDALRFCFGVCTDGTALAGADLDIIRVAARARCDTCGGEHATSSLAAPCPCGSFARTLIAGDELRLKHVEVV